MEKIFEITLDIHTYSEANTVTYKTKTGMTKTENRFQKSKRHRQQKAKIAWMFLLEKAPIILPCTIKMIRLAPRFLDESDNLPMAFKWIKDAIAEYLIPGKKVGRADDDRRISWKYDQEKLAKDYKVRIEIYA